MYKVVTKLFLNEAKSIIILGKDLRSALAVEDEGLCQAIRKTAPELFEEES